ncbi:uncharacterized protein VTP21DRAFT_9044 [Calcarisporiella thermophila]|uniref:uncharacterized protein n=1 Tax=Calcarisporiella thermophila TaxID=911321 RepID=UPI0037438C5F
MRQLKGIEQGKVCNPRFTMVQKALEKAAADAGAGIADARAWNSGMSFATYLSIHFSALVKCSFSAILLRCAMRSIFSITALRSTRTITVHGGLVCGLHFFSQCCDRVSVAADPGSEYLEKKVEDNSPPKVRDLNFALHPVSDASVVAILDRAEGRNDFLFHILGSSAQHSNSSNASCGRLNEVSQHGLVLSALVCAIISDLENSLLGNIAGNAIFDAPKNTAKCRDVVNPMSCVRSSGSGLRAIFKVDQKTSCFQGLDYYLSVLHRFLSREGCD